MAGKIQEVRWTQGASQALENIFVYYALKSVRGATNVVQDIIEKAESILYPNQYQVDELNPDYRRMIVRDYKVLYYVIETTVHIVDIVSTRKNLSKK